MRRKTKRYTLSDNVTKEKLEEAGFRKGGFMSGIPFPKYFYNQCLCKDIELHIEVRNNSDGTFFFDDQYSTYVIDDEFGQPYYPFYTKDENFPFLNKVILEYNKVMDKLVEKGILKELVLEQEENKTIKLTNK